MVFLCQYLCPQRHCIMAVAYDQATSPAEAEAELRAAVDALWLNPWCGLCGSQELTCEHAPTPYRTLREAYPALKASEQANLRTRAMLSGRYN